MNEWHQLLSQSHAKYNSGRSIDSTENATPSQEIAQESIQNEGHHKSEDTPLEWISSTAQLQNSIAKIPDKMAFKIGEAADLVGVKQYVLRYWESEFDALKPKKSKNGQRMYTRKDVETGLYIKKLLHDDRFSIEGARSALKRLKRQMREKDKGLDVQVDPPKGVVLSGQKLFGERETSIEKVQPDNKTAADFRKRSLRQAEGLLHAVREARKNLGLGDFL